MKKRLLAKLRGRAGESIAETLIALLISALALVMLAGAISSAANIVRTSKNWVSHHNSQMETIHADWLQAAEEALMPDGI